LYKKLKFDIPVGTTGDCYDRYLIRMEEMRQSASLILQCINALPAGHIKIQDHKVVHPKRASMKTHMEDTIHHFKYFTENITLPKGEIYLPVEAPKGELGTYIRSVDENTPYKCHFRSPGYAHLQALELLTKGHVLADLVTNIGTIDIVFGEVDR